MMDKKLLAIAVIILLLVSVGVYMFFFPRERGTEDHPYMIEDVQDLQDMNEDLDAHYALANDIDASETEEWNDGKGFEPIGPERFENSFTGTLDGRGHEINGLYINRTEDYIGLFGCIRRGEVRDLILEDIYVRGDLGVGGIAGYLRRELINIRVTGEVKGNQSVGGLVGQGDYGRVYDSQTSVEVEGEKRVGGLMGYSWESRVVNSHSTEDVMGDIVVGGLVGYHWGGTIDDSYSKGDVMGNQLLGGLVGENEYRWRIDNSYYNYEEVLINGEHNKTVAGIPDEKFTRWIESDLWRDVEFEGGSGTEEDPYLIADVYQLQSIRGDVDAHYELIDDVNARRVADWNVGLGFRPIDSFSGTFDGSGHTVNELYIDRTRERPIGFFGSLEEDGVIRNVGLEDASVRGSNSVGALVGSNDGGTVHGSWAEGSIEATSDFLPTAGGLIGDNEGVISNSYFSDGEVVAHRIGGFVGGGQYSGTVENSFFNIDSVRINGRHRVDFLGLYEEQFQDWISNDLTLDVSDYYDSLDPEQDHYEIDGLQGLKDLLGFAGDEEYSFKLTRDIDLSAAGSFRIPYLEAEFNGDNHTIEGLSLNVDDYKHIGLFDYIGQEGRVANTNVVDADVRGNNHVGILAGENRGMIVNSSTEGTVNGDDTLGGLVGANDGKVMNSHASVERTLNGNNALGGLIGSNEEKVMNSHASVDLSGNRLVGGLIGWNSGGQVLSSYATGDASGESNVGGLLGYNRRAQVYNSFATGDISGTQYVGGLVGFQYTGTIANSYSTGEVRGSEAIGGLVGYNRDTENTEVEDSFWNEDTSGQPTSDGGTGKTAEEMMDQKLFSEAGWDITVVEDEDELDTEYKWNIVEGETYPFLSEKEAEPVEEEDLDPIDGGICAVVGLIIMGLVVVYLVTKDDRENEGDDALQSEKGDETFEGEDID